MFTLLTLFILVLPFVLAYIVKESALKVQEWTGRLAVVFFNAGCWSPAVPDIADEGQSP